MRKSILSMSIAAMIGGLGLAGGASAAVFSDAARTTGVASGTGVDIVTAKALVIDNTGIGHQLIVPYFSTQNGNITTLNLVNTDNVRGKLVKIRFRGASNSDDLLDFQVFLSPADVWTASLAANKTTGITELTTNDNSCTLPLAMKGTTVPFGTGRLNQALTGDTLAQETREGYIEIINTADIPSQGLAGQATSATAASGYVPVNPLFTAVKHVAGTAPCTAATLNATLKDPKVSTSVAANTAAATAVADPTELAASTMGLVAPTGLLFGNSIIVNVPNTTTFPSEAVALRAITATDGTGVNATANLVHFPQLNAAVPSNSTATAGTVIGDLANAYRTLPADVATADPLLRSFLHSVKQQNGAGVVTSSVGTTTMGGGNTAQGKNYGVAVIPPNYLDLPDLSTPYLLLPAITLGDASGTLTAGAGLGPYLSIGQAAHTTKAIAATTVANEILGNTGISGKTDWVFSMPTRRYSVAQNYSWVSKTASGGDDGRMFTNFVGAALGTNAGANNNVTNVADAAFPYFAPSNTVVGGLNNTQICVTGITSTSYDQSETTTTSSTAASFSPPSAAAPGVQWCGETNVLSFNAGSNTAASVLGAKVARQNVNTVALDGWVSLATPAAARFYGAPVAGNLVLDAANQFAAAHVQSSGLPVLGSAYQQAFNPAAATGVSGNYGVRFLHRFTR